MIIEVENLHKSYGQIEILKGIDLELHKGEVVSIIGSSGAGKTTLLQILGTLDSDYIGSVKICGIDLSKLKGDKLARFRCEKLGFVFQSHHLLPEFTALENVMMPSLIAGKSIKESEKKAIELLDLLGLSHRINHKPSQLSGGEAQRVAIARALINNPEIIFADEPSGNLDTKNKEELHRLFFTLRDKFNVTIVVVTHDLYLADMSDRKITIVDGVIK